MNFAEALKRLDAVVTGRQPGEQAETCRVRRQDLRELLHHFRRLDADVRQAAPATDHVVGSAGTVPEDIRQAAQKAWDDAMALTSDAQSEMVIAQAILAERQASPSQQMVASEINITLAAQRIFEVFCGGPVDWSRHSLNDADDNLFASADWAQAMLYAKAAFAAATADQELPCSSDVASSHEVALEDGRGDPSPQNHVMGDEAVAIQALKKIEAAALGGYLTPDLCAEIVTSALAPEATPTSSFDVESWAAGDGVWNGDKWVPAGNSEGKR